MVRLVAASLRESGFRVLAKTTGAKPMLIFPDGSEGEIKRGELPSILEQKKLLKKAAKLEIDVLVSELMSIQPEACYSESVQIIRPHFLIITNVRLDHMAQMGSTKEEIARCFASSIPEKSTAFVLREEFFPVFQKTAGKRESKLIQVTGESFDEYFPSKMRFPFLEFKENIHLALAVTDFLGIKREVAVSGMGKVQADFGSVKIWRAKLESPPRNFYFVSAFSANDPESTRLVLFALKEKGIFEGKKMIGLLNFRKDRGDRTLQWLEALKENAFPELSKFYLVGFHAPAFIKGLGPSIRTSVHFLRGQTPTEITEQILAEEEGEGILFGMGNIGGAGQQLVDYWESRGMPYDL